MRSPEREFQELQAWCIIDGQKEIRDQELLCLAWRIPWEMGWAQWKFPFCHSEEGPRRESLGSGRGLLEEERRGTQTGHSYLGGCSDFHIFPSLQVCWGMSKMKGRVMSSAVFTSALPFPLIFRESLWL